MTPEQIEFYKRTYEDESDVWEDPKGTFFDIKALISAVEELAARSTPKQSDPTIQITEKQLAEQIEKGFMAGAQHALEKLAPQLHAELEEKFAARSTPKQGVAFGADERDGPTPGYPKTSRDWLAALVDIWDDMQNNAPEDRAYVPGSLAESIDEARAHLAATYASVEPGWVRVPVEPTQEMLKAAERVWETCTDGQDFLHEWQAMVFAAPKEPKP